MTDRRFDDQPILDMRALTDSLRPSKPVVQTRSGDWVLLRHADVMAAALDHDRFSSKVSRFLQIPNGLDGDEHSRFRSIIDRYLDRAALEPFLPKLERITAALVAELPRGRGLDAVGEIGAVFAVRAQCAWLGWPIDFEPRLLQWMADNHDATRSGDLSRTAAVAEEFDDIVRAIIATRRGQGGKASDDVTTRLCRATVDGRPLSEPELVSILRNWTGGDLGSIALCVGVIVARLAADHDLATRLREASDDELEECIDEILRVDDPFLSNRRMTTCPVRIGDKDIPTGDRVILNWTSANRDEAVFPSGLFDPQSHRALNLVYGIGKHVCPGRLLATWELRVLTRTLLSAVRTIEQVPEHPNERAVVPAGGYQRVPIILH